MSTSIDNRVVGLQFNNKNFEKNVDQTLTSLDKLHNKLKSKGAARGLTELEKAADRCDLSNVSKAADTIQHRFSAMGIVGMNVLNRIADTAVNTASRMLKAFTIAPVTQGYQEYELKMASVQTIMASTGESIGTVNGYLEELNRYSDRTIYSFSDMTQNIGKFTNAGVKLEDAVSAIQGISNEAALSGANANEAARAMYNFSQALSSGAIRLIDWKSIENANMATKEFKQELINTAVAMGTLKATGDGMYKSGKAVFNATKSFNDSLQTQWMTSEVLIKTLGRYSDETTDIGKRAFAAAQDIKTYSQLVDTVKESIGSGWAQVSELILGDLEEAKEMWSSVGKSIGDAVNNFFDPITDFLSSNLDSKYKRFLKDGPISGADKWISDYQEVVDARNKPLQEELDQNNQIIQAYDEERKARMKYNERVRELKETGWYTTDQGYKARWLPKPEEFKHTTEEVEKLKLRNEELNKQLEDTTFRGDDLKKAYLKHFDDTSNSLLHLMNAGYSYNEALEKIGVSEEKWLDMKKMRNDIMSGAVSVEEMAKAFNELSNRKKIVLGLGNAFKFMGSVLKPIKEAFNSIFFGSMNANWLGNLANKFYEFSTNLKVDSEILDTVRQTFTGIFSGFQAVGRMIGNVFKAITSKLPPAGIVLKGLGGAFLMLGNELSKLGNKLAVWIDSGEFMAAVMKVWTQVTAEFNSALGEIDEQLRAIPELTPVIDFFDRFGASMDKAIASGDYKQVAKVFHDAFVEIGNNIGEFWNSIKNTDFASVWETIQFKISTAISKITDKFEFLKSKLKGVVEFVKNKFNINLESIVSTGFLAVLGIGLVKMVKGVTAISKGFIKIQSSLSRIGDRFAGVLKSVSKFINAKTWTERAKGFRIAAFGLVELSLAVGVLAGSMWLISKIPSDKLLDSALTIGIMITTLAGIAVLASKFGGDKGALSIIAIAGAVVAIATAAKILSTIEFKSFNISSLLYLGEALGAIYVLAHLANRASKAGDGIAKSALSVIALAAALLSVVYVMKTIAEMDLSSIKTGITNLGIAFAALAALFLLTRLAGKNSAKGGLAMLSIAASLYMLVPMVLLLSTLPAHVVKKATKTIAALGLIFKILIGSTKKAGKNTHKAAAVILAIALAMIPLTAVIYMLGHMDTSACIQGVIAVGIIFSVLALVLNQAGKMNGNIKSLISVIGIILTLGIVISALSLIKDIKSVIASAGSLALAMAALSLLIFTIGKVKIDWTAIGKIAIITLIVGALAGVIAALSYIPDPRAAVIMAISLGGLLLTLSATLAILNAVGKVTTGASLLYGLVGLVAVVATFGLILAALGGLADSWSNAEDFINRGIPLLEAIGEGIGRLVGGALGGIVGGTLDAIGNSLSRFKDKLNPFLESVGDIPKGLGENVKNISEAILAMTASDMLSGITGFLHLTGMSAFATNIKEYGAGLTAFSESISGLDESTLNKTRIAAEAGKTLAEMANTIPNDGGLWGEIVGNNDLGTFSANLKSFGTAMTELSASAEGLNIRSIENLAKAGTKLADMATSIPNSGGLLGDIMGNNDVDDFVASLEGFGTAMVTVSTSGEGIDLNNIENLAKAGTKLAEMASAIPNDGGLWGEIVGNNDAGTFGASIRDFAWGVARATNISVSIVPDKLDSLEVATRKLSTISNLVSNWSFDENKLASFKTAFEDYIKWFSGSVGDTSLIGDASAATSIVHMISSISESFDNISNTVSGCNVSGFGSFQTAFSGYIEWLRGLSDPSLLGDASITAMVINMVSSITESLTANQDDFMAAGTMNMQSFINGLVSKRVMAGVQAGTVAGEAVGVLRGRYSQFYTAGAYVIQGFINGMESKRGAVRSTANSIGQDSVDEVNKGGGNRSPSHKTFKSGVYIAQGFINGMNHMVKAVNQSGYKLGSESVSAISDAIYGVRNIVEHDMEIHPVISPVIDMADVDKGFSDISAMYNRNQVISVARGRNAVTSQNVAEPKAPVNSPTNYSFVQNNYSPKALSQIDIYRNTKNQFALAKGVLNRSVT